MHSFHSADTAKGVLFLADPFRSGKWMEEVQRNYSNTTALIFRENERCLHRVRSELWEMRRRYEWICVAAEGSTAGLALALAAQLPVDRLALRFSSLSSPGTSVYRLRGLEKELARIEAFAKRNLMLVASEILMIDCGKREEAFLLRNLGRNCRLRSLHTQTADAQIENWQELLLDSWEGTGENRLRIPWKCV